MVKRMDEVFNCGRSLWWHRTRARLLGTYLHLMKFQSIFCSALLLFGGSFAAAVDLVTKSYQYSQTDASTLVPYTSSTSFPYLITATLAGTATTPSGPITLITPSGVAQPLSFTGTRWELSKGSNSADVFNAVFPDGTYIYTFAGKNITLSMPTNARPNPMVITVSGGTWSNGSLYIDPTQPLTISTAYTQNFVSGRSQIDLIVEGITPAGVPYQVAGVTGTLTQNQVSLVVPANALVPGSLYTINASGTQIVTTDSTTVSGYLIASTYASRTVATLYGGVPAFTVQPTSQTVAPGSTVVFSAATGASGVVYYWMRNGVRITNPSINGTLVLSGIDVVAGTYACVATAISGTITSRTVDLKVVATNNPGRLINLSVLTPLEASEVMTMGTVLGGAGTSGTKALLARAVGPSLAQVGVTGVLPDPQMVLINGTTSAVVASNNDWQGAEALTNAFSQVGAFAYVSATSKDAAIFSPTLASGSYTVQVSDQTGGAGTAIAELYDSTPPASVTAATPRLINVSVRKQIASGTILTAGFVIGGTTAKTVLVRAIGPGLAQFGVGGIMSDPKLALYNGSAKISENDDWGGDVQLTGVGAAVGAFAIQSPTSKDAMLLMTLEPGQYSAQVTGAGAGGVALVEVYDVP